MSAIITWKRDTPQQPVVATEPWRFGLIFGPPKDGFPKGDIHEACCAQALATHHGKGLPSVSRYILHGGLRYAIPCTGGSVFRPSADGYELIELAPGMVPPPREKYCYNGERVKVNGRECVMVRPVRFVSRLLTVEECRWNVRHQYAWGGHFALIHDTYAKFLAKQQQGWEPGGTWAHNAGEAQAANVREAHRLDFANWRKLPVAHHAMQKLTLCDPMLLAAPWKQAQPVRQARAARPKVKLTLTADDHLASLIASLGK